MQDNMPKDKRETTDTRFAILILQIVTVLIILGFAAGIRIFGGKMYDELSALYHKKFDDITLVSDVLKPNEKDVSSDSSEPLASELEENEPENAGGGNSGDSSDDMQSDPIEGTVTGYINNPQTAKTVAAVGNTVNTFLWPVSGKLTSDYGFRTNPVTGQYRMHGGIDIGANTGTPIMCAYDGRVTAAGYSDSYGYYIIVKHNDNVETLYGHCSELVAREGEYVKRGETVALVGSTGRSTGAHLHFEIRVGGCRIDPRWILGDQATAV